MNTFKMSIPHAKRIIGNQPVTCVRNMAIALSLMTWRNTAADWERLEAACTVLGRGAPKRARATLKAHREPARI